MTPVSPPAVVVVDADACVPPSLREHLPLRVAPDDPPLLHDRVPIPRLALDAGPVDAGPVVEACAAAAEDAAAVLFVAVGDGYGGALDANERAAEVVRERGATYASCATGHALMAAGWPAVLAAEAVARGASATDAAATASRAAGGAQLLAYLEHPELVGLADTPSPTARAVTRISGDRFGLISALPKRDQGLVMLRDRFGEMVASEPPGGALRVAVHHAGTAPAAEAMATWIRRNTDAAQVVIAPLTRHAGTRLGPGMLGMAWIRDPDFAPL